VKITSVSASALAQEPGITGTDLRVWLHLVDRERTPSELAQDLGIATTNVAASCRKLHVAGWLDLTDKIGRAKRYRARNERSASAALPGQTMLDL